MAQRASVLLGLTTLFGLFAVAGLLAVAGCPANDSAPPPPRSTEPVNSDLAAAENRGGCYPTNIEDRALGQVVLVNPEWAPVTNGRVVESRPVYAHGTVRWSHGDTGGDFPGNHVRSDFNAAIELDDADRGLLGTGNLSESDVATLEEEWEAGAYPAWAWPSAGDRVVLLGRWIFDCGHPDLRPRTCTKTTAHECSVPDDCRAPACPECTADETCDRQHYGYSTELHPPQASAAIRSKPRGGLLSDAPDAKPVLVTQADVFVSPNGGAAGDRCVLTHEDDASTLIFDTDCYPLKEPLAPINAEDFVFELPLPTPRPAGAHAKWRVASREAPGDVPAGVSITADEDAAEPHLVVRVKMTEAIGGKLPTGYAATIFAGWDAPATVELTHLRVTIDELEILDALRPATPVVREVKIWHGQVGVNGDWQELDPLLDVEVEKIYRPGLVFELYLPSDAKLEVEASGTSQACIDTLFGRSLKTMLAELGLTDAIDCLMTTARDPGVIDVEHAGPTFDVGAGAMQHEARTSAYVLRYTVARVP